MYEYKANPSLDNDFKDMEEKECYIENDFLICFCGKCKPEDYALPKDFPHQPDKGYENATDEEKTTMMLQIAKEANAEQKAMFEPEKQPWETKIIEEWDKWDNGVFESQKHTIDFIAQLLKEERERCIGIVGNVLSIKPTPEQLFTTIAYKIEHGDGALQVINKEA